MSSRPELADDQRSLQSAAYTLDFLWKFAVMPCAAQDIIEDSDEIADIVADVFCIGRAPIVHVDEFYSERESLTLDDDVVIVEVAVIFACAVYLLDARGEGMQQVESLEWCEALTRLARHEIAEQFSLDKF